MAAFYLPSYIAGLSKDELQNVPALYLKFLGVSAIAARNGRAIIEDNNAAMDFFNIFKKAIGINIDSFYYNSILYRATLVAALNEMNSAYNASRSLHLYDMVDRGEIKQEEIQKYTTFDDVLILTLLGGIPSSDLERALAGPYDKWDQLLRTVRSYIQSINSQAQQTTQPQQANNQQSYTSPLQPAVNILNQASSPGIPQQYTYTN